MEKATHHKEEKVGRKLRADLTNEERERLEEFGSIDFKSAGAVRKTDPQH